MGDAVPVTRQITTALLSNHSTPPEYKPSCGIWLAPSAIEGAGLGMYAGKKIKKGDLFQDVGDLCM
jgi:hypothetical protein